MKVSYFSHTNLPSATANSVHIMRMCEALAGQRCEVSLYAMRGVNNGEDIYNYYGVEKNFDIKLWGAPWLKGRLYMHCLRTSLKLRSAKPDVIICRSLVGAYYLSRMGVKFVYENHNPRGTLKTASQKRMFDRVIRSANMHRMIVISDALKQILITETGISADRVLVYHDGATEAEVPGTALSFNGGSGRLHVGYIGTIGKGRGIELIVQCAEQLPWADFHIAGGTREQAEKMLDLKTIPGNIYFYGFVAPADTEFYRRQCDVLVAPYQQTLELRSGKNSSGYMSPLKIFEYMASRKAIIASDLPVIREVLNEENAVLCSADSVEAWVEAISALANHTTRRNKLGEQAYQDFTHHYTWHKRAEHILQAVTQ